MSSFMKTSFLFRKILDLSQLILFPILSFLYPFYITILSLLIFHILFLNISLLTIILMIIILMIIQINLILDLPDHIIYLLTCVNFIIIQHKLLSFLSVLIRWKTIFHMQRFHHNTRILLWFLCQF